MENPNTNQLPEADSLPDGFVESFPEPLAPLTPQLEHEKLVDNSFSESDCSNDLGDKSLRPLDFTDDSTEKAQKLRTFPVPLFEKDNFDDSAEGLEKSHQDSLEQREVMLGSSDSVSVAPVTISECSEAKEQVQTQCQSSERSVDGGSDTQAINLKGISPSESIENQKNRKQEASDVKRKSGKRTFKSEKEFLEFTLKYQQVLTERDSAIAVRDKLESLCRELQRQNKMLMDECRRVSTEGQNLRLDLSTRFQDAIKDVSSKLDEQKDECLSQLKENEMLRSKLKQFSEQYTLCEHQFSQTLKQKSLELQLADLKIKQSEEKLVQEQSQMKLYADQVSQLLATEKNLRLQLTADGEKFQQFQEAMIKSNEVFETFKQEIEKMAKSIKELKKENTFLKSKCEKSDYTLIELVEEREHMKKQLEKTKNQKEKLESLCRSLQKERKQNSSESSDAVSI